VVSRFNGFEIFSLLIPATSLPPSPPLLFLLVGYPDQEPVRIEGLSIFNSEFTLFHPQFRAFSFDPLAFPSPRPFFLFFSPLTQLFIRRRGREGMHPLLLPRLSNPLRFSCARVPRPTSYIHNKRTRGRLSGLSEHERNESPTRSTRCEKKKNERKKGEKIRRMARIKRNRFIKKIPYWIVCTLRDSVESDSLKLIFSYTSQRSVCLR